MGLVVDLMDVGEVGIDDGGGRAVDGDAVTDVAGGGAVNVAAVDHEIGGAVGAEEGDVGAAGGSPGGGDVQADEAVVVGAAGHLDRGIAAGIEDPGHQAGLGGGDAGAGSGETGERGGLEIDPAGAGLIGEGEVAGIGSAGRQDD